MGNHCRNSWGTATVIKNIDSWRRYFLFPGRTTFLGWLAKTRITQSSVHRVIFPPKSSSLHLGSEPPINLEQQFLSQTNFWESRDPCRVGPTDGQNLVLGCVDAPSNDNAELKPINILRSLRTNVKLAIRLKEYSTATHCSLQHKQQMTDDKHPQNGDTNVK